MERAPSDRPWAMGRGTNKGLEGPPQQFPGSLARSKCDIPEGHVLGVFLHHPLPKILGPIHETGRAPVDSCSPFIAGDLRDSGTLVEYREIASGICQLEGVDCVSEDVQEMLHLGVVSAALKDH